MICSSCSNEVLNSWHFCPHCGSSLKNSLKQTKIIETPRTSTEVPQRFLDLIEDYESLTGSKVSTEIIQDFLSHAAVRKLSVIERIRRMKSGRQARKQVGKGLFSLDLDKWLNHIYDNPETNVTRVWLTMKGDKYHLQRDCKGLRDGQNYAKFFGKDTYNPQFLELRYVAFVLGKVPCAVCKPPIYKK